MKHRPRIITLMYHRIDKTETDPWGICVSPEHFEEQILIVQNHFPVITAEETAQQVTEHTISENSVCITFDDGYADNYIHALPVLKRYGCPATFFIATAFTGGQLPFWWDELEMICLHTKHLPAQLTLSVSKSIYHFNFETELAKRHWKQHCNWKWYEEPPTLRCQSFIGIWMLLRSLPYIEIEKQMIAIRFWSDTNFHSRLPMTEEQLQMMSCEPLSSIGLHTHTHMDLAGYDAEEQIKDIRMNKENLHNKYGIDSSIISYPFGSYEETTLHAIEQLNIKAGFTTKHEAVKENSDLKQLGRYQVFNRSGQDFEEQLLKWMSE